MQIKEKTKEGILICYISGELNLDSCVGFKKACKKLIADKARKVLLNFKELDYIDSSGLACLIEFSKELKNIEGVVFLSDLSPKIRSLFAITKLENAFKIYESEEEALKDFYGY